MIDTAACHHEVIETFWLHFWGPFMPSISYTGYTLHILESEHYRTATSCLQNKYINASNLLRFYC